MRKLYDCVSRPYAGTGVLIREPREINSQREEGDERK